MLSEAFQTGQLKTRTKSQCFPWLSFFLSFGLFLLYCCFHYFTFLFKNNKDKFTQKCKFSHHLLVPVGSQGKFCSPQNTSRASQQNCAEHSPKQLRCYGDLF